MYYFPNADMILRSKSASVSFSSYRPKELVLTSYEIVGQSVPRETGVIIREENYVDVKEEIDSFNNNDLMSIETGNNLIVISIKNNASIQSLAIYKINGSLVKSFKTIQKENIHRLKSQPEGIYFVKAHSNGKEILKKIIINR